MDAPAQKNPGLIKSIMPENPAKNTENNSEQPNIAETPIMNLEIETVQDLSASIDPDDTDDNANIPGANVVDLRSDTPEEAAATLQNVSPEADGPTKEADKEESEFIQSIVEEHGEL